MATSFNSAWRSLASQCRRQTTRPALDLQQPRKCARMQIAKTDLIQRRLIHSHSQSRSSGLPSSSSSSTRTAIRYTPPTSSSISRSPFSTTSQRPILSWLSSGSKNKSKSKADSNKPPEIYINTYTAQRQWPPDVSSMSEKQQFRLERKYRRRAKLKYARPLWTKWTKLVQWGLIGFVLVYAVLFMEMKDSGPNPFANFRKYLSETFSGSMWTTPPPRLRKDVESADSSPTDKS